MKNRIFNIFGVLAVAAITSGCGMAPAPRLYSAASEPAKAVNSIYTTTTDADSDYRCASSSNVNPDYDYNRDGTGYFTACTHRTKMSDLLIKGETSRSNQICVFPVEYVDASHIYLKPDTTTMNPWVQCGEVTDLGVHVSFPDIQFNAAFIVEGDVKDQMMNCLITGRYLTCPAYSYGRFR